MNAFMPEPDWDQTRATGSADGTPPSLINVEAEAALLGAAMIDNAVLDRAIEHIDPADFSMPLHSRIWAALARERAAGRHAGAIALKGYFEGDEDLAAVGGFGYLARLSGDSTGLLIPTRELAGQINDLAVRRRVRTGLMETAGQCADLERAVAEIVSDVDGVIRAPSEQSARQSTGGEAMDDLIASLDEPRTGVTCGIIPDLDELLGSLRPGSMNVIAGRPGMGKTAVALTYARGAAELGHGVQLFSLEMGRVDLAGRVAADMCFDLTPAERIAYSAIRDRDLSESQRRDVARAAKHLHSIPLAIVDTGSITIGRLRAMVRSQKRRMAAQGNSLDVVVVDYLQLVRPDSSARSAYEAVSEVSRGLKALAMDEQVALIALAQLSRSVETRPDKRPQLSDLRDSGQIEQDADAVLFLLRQEYYLRQAEPVDADDDAYGKWEADLKRVQGVIEFILPKRRNGSPGSAYGRFYGVYQAVRGTA